ncbi:MAG: AmmeMemoRadiSam system protein A [Gammaproteobacteria bacterium]|nr:AmmeMemoRadiSam system protein A [Gammaproteobacteria bacterium]
MSSNLTTEHIFQLDRPSQLQLLAVAHTSIKLGLDQQQSLRISLSQYPATVQSQGASFITLRIQGELRGCIGTLEARQPLVQDVAQNAFNAAFRDPRFAPVSSRDYSLLDIHISVLSPATVMSFRSEADLLRQLRPGIDGLILSENGYRGTFLPAVWASLPAAEEFFQQLKLKAGLPADYWSPTLRAERYTTFSFSD